MKSKNYFLLATGILGFFTSLSIHAQSCTSLTVGANPPGICPGAVSTLTVGGSNGTQYNWSTGGTGTIIVVGPSVTTTYSVTGKKGNCIETKTVMVTVYPLPTISVNSGAICSGQSFTMIPTGASNYTFSGGSAIVSPTLTSSYSVTGTSSLGCVGSNVAVSTVTVDTPPVITVNSGSICSGQSFTMVPSGAATYTFSGGSAVVSPTITTSYSVTGTSSGGCESASPAISTVSVAPSPVITVNSGSICAGDSFTLVPSGANTYTFSGGSAIVSPTTTTSYSVTGTNTEGCVSASPAVANVTVNALPVITVNSGAICAGQSFTMVPSGANTYTFSGGSAVVSPTSAASYSVTGTSAEGCVCASPAIANVTVNALPVITVNSGSICSGDSFTLVPSGANTYTFSGGSAIVSPTSTASYSVSGTSAEGCVSALPAISTVTVNVAPVANAGADQTIYYGYGPQCVTLSGTATGAPGPYQYSWSNGGGTQSISVCPTVTAVYDLTVTANGCQGTDAITVNVIEVSCQNEKVMVCHNGHEICVAPAAVAAHLAHGDYLGACTQQRLIQGINENEDLAERGKIFSLFPNPNTGAFAVELNKGEADGPVKIEIMNSVGQLVYSGSLRMNSSRSENIELTNKVLPGIYFIHLKSGNKIHVAKMIVQ